MPCGADSSNCVLDRCVPARRVVVAPQAHYVQERAGYLGRETRLSGHGYTLLGVCTDDYGACSDIGSF